MRCRWHVPRCSGQYRGNDGGEGEEEYGGSDVNDVLNLLPLLESLPFVDSDGIGMYGWSRGGMETYIAITRTDKIKAAVVGGGVTDLIQTFEEAEERPVGPSKQLLIEIIGCSPAEKEEEYKNRSAYYWPERIDTPILILHGEDDENVNVTQAKKLASELEELGKTYELIIYPDGGHGLGEHREDVNSRLLEWFAKYV